ncbi:g9990 [Coccomyxa viridis]|uniref:G9990 protein n=1 Tax=Coccomyxa viridis TaxID=1274662 RepID=A0ABP1G473_9CHLO
MRVGTETCLTTVAAQTDACSTPFYTLTEVSQHCTPQDCWLIIHGKVYDVTSWIPRHPGGSLIHVRSGEDCSYLFDAYHPLSARLFLESFYIGELRQSAAGAEIVQYKDDAAKGQFYDILRRRVEKFFRGNEINPRTSLAWCLKAVLIVGCWIVSFYGTFFGLQSFMASALCACMLGLSMGEAGVSIMHDVNHGSGLTDRSARYALGMGMDLIGVSSFLWRQQHVVGHHTHTNLETDPDIRASEQDVRRVAPHHQRRWYHKYQHIYLGVLYGLLVVKAVLVDDFKALADGAIGPLRLARMTNLETAVFWGCKALYIAYFIALPVLRSHHSVVALLALWLISEVVAGWMFAFLFQVAHVTGDVQFPKTKEGKVDMGWAAGQVATTADFSHGSWFWTHFSGGLNYQVVHHLFPNICHTHYPAIAPIVVDTCREFGVPYKVFPSFLSAMSAHFQHLKAMGAPSLIPSFSSLG